MKKIRKNGYWTLLPAKGMLLTDGSTVSAEVCCPADAATEKWREVTEADAEAIMEKDHDDGDMTREDEP